MVTCPICSNESSYNAMLHVHDITATICYTCGSIHIQETGQIIRMGRNDFYNGFMAVAWAMGELNKAWPDIQVYLRRE